MSDIDRLTAILLLPLARGVDFIAACIRLAAELAEPGEQGCPSRRGSLGKIQSIARGSSPRPRKPAATC
jgi:hypothetical protein